MKNYPLWKSILVVSVLIAGIIFSIPSILYKEDSGSWFLENKINLGLDLQGGSYLLLEVKSEVLFKEELDNVSDSLRLIARELKVTISNIDSDSDEIQIRFTNSDNLLSINGSPNACKAKSVQPFSIPCFIKSNAMFVSNLS